MCADSTVRRPKKLSSFVGMDPPRLLLVFLLCEGPDLYPFCCNIALSLSHLWLFVSPMDGRMLSIFVLHCFLEFAHIHVHWVSYAIQPSHLIPPPSPFAFDLSQHQGLFQCQPFASGGQICFSSSISPSNEYSGLIAFMIDWFDLLLIQETLHSLLQHHNLKTSIF